MSVLERTYVGRLFLQLLLRAAAGCGVCVGAVCGAQLVEGERGTAVGGGGGGWLNNTEQQSSYVLYGDYCRGLAVSGPTPNINHTLPIQHIR